MSKLSDRIQVEDGAFVTIPNLVIELIPEMGPEAFVLWSYLRFRTNDESSVAIPTYKAIHADTGLNSVQVARAMKKLRKLGLVDLLNSEPE